MQGGKIATEYHLILISPRILYKVRQNSVVCLYFGVPAPPLGAFKKDGNNYEAFLGI